MREPLRKREFESAHVSVSRYVYVGNRNLSINCVNSYAFLIMEIAFSES